MKSIFKNKLLTILVLFSILVATMCTCVFADSEEVYNNGITLNLSRYHVSYYNLPVNPSDYEYYFIQYDPNHYDAFWVYLTHSPLKVGRVYSGNDYRIINTDGMILYNYNGLETVESSAYGLGSYEFSIDYSTNSNYITIADLSSGTYTISNSISYFITNHDVMHGDDVWYSSSGSSSDVSVVFQGAPQAQVAQVELMKATQVEEILPQIIAVVEIVLPIFLGIFGVLLVLYLIKSKNLLHL